jgi:hypothetical protein
MRIKVDGKDRSLRWLVDRMKSLLGGPVFLKRPITHTSFDGDSFNDVSTPTLIENTSWSRDIPEGAKALLLRIRIRDSGSESGSGIYFTCGPSSDEFEALSVTANNVTNNTQVHQNGICPCIDGDIYYECGTSGGGSGTTLDIWLECWGYWL